MKKNKSDKKIIHLSILLTTVSLQQKGPLKRIDSSKKFFAFVKLSN